MRQNVEHPPRARLARVVKAYLHGTSTRKVDDLVNALGADTNIHVRRLRVSGCTGLTSLRDAS